MMNRRRSFTLSYRIESFIYDLPRLYRKYHTLALHLIYELFCAVGVFGFMYIVIILSSIR